MKKEIVDLYLKFIGEGKSHNESMLDIVEKFANEDDDAVFKSIESAQKVLEFDKKKQVAEAEKAKKAEVEAQVSEIVAKQVDEELSKIKTKGFFEESHSRIEVQDNWKSEAAEGFRLFVSKKMAGGLDSKSEERFRELTEKKINRLVCKYKELGYKEKAVDAIIAGVDSSGGYSQLPQFDKQLDMLIKKRSLLLEAIQIREGTEKDLINSINGMTLEARENENAPFAKAKPTFYQQEVRFREFGRIVDISEDVMDGSDYNLIEELLQLLTSAKIDLLEPLLTTSSINVNNDMFNGVRFIGGSTNMFCKNNGITGGTGRLTSQDLEQAVALLPAASRREPSFFVMNQQEVSILVSERDLQDRPLQILIPREDGSYFHTMSGRRVIIVDSTSRTLNAQVDRTTGTDVLVSLITPERFRIYQDGGMQIKISSDYGFETKTIGLRASVKIKTGVPIMSRSSMINILGVKNNSI